MKDHCCECEIARRRNLRVFVVTMSILLVVTCVAAYAAFKHNWLATAGWGLWGVLGTVVLLFSDQGRTYCDLHDKSVIEKAG